MRCLICNADIDDGTTYCPRCGAVQTRFSAGEGEQDALLGKVLVGRFKLEKLLGIGGMGKVFKARHLADDQPVVVKILHDHLAVDRKLVLRFKREWRAIRRIDHPHVIRVLDFGLEEEGRAYIAMDYVEGADLASLLDGPEPPDEERVIRIGVQVCDALAEAHAKKVLHRDLKPENIMIGEKDGQADFVRVLDFGIAKIQDPDDQTGVTLTRAGEAFGTFEYMSPEQARCQPLDARSDVYQFGVLLYELTTRRLPFGGETPLEIVSSVIRDEPMPPSELDLERPPSPALEAIILKAIAKKAKDRFQSAVALGDALRALLPDAPPRPKKRMVKPLTRVFDAAGAGLASVSAPIGRVPLLSRIVPVSRAGRAGLGLCILVLLAGAAMAATAFLRTDEFGEVRDALAHGKPARAMGLLKAHSRGRSPEGQALRARALLGRKKPDRKRAWKLLQGAVLKSPELIEDDDVVADLIATLDRGKAGETVGFLARRMGSSIADELLEASRSERYWLRWNSVAVLQKIGAGERIDLGQAYILDLRLARSCATRKRAAQKLGEMGELRAGEALVEANARPAEDNNCMGLVLEQALWAIEKKRKRH